MSHSSALLRPRLALAGAIVLSITGLGSLSAGLAQEAAPPAEVLESGRIIYLDQCESCHGPDGKGDGAAARFLDPPPKDFTTGEWQHAGEGTVAAISEVIRAGIDGTGMTPFDELLTEDEIVAVASYVIHVLAKEGDPGS